MEMKSLDTLYEEFLDFMLAEKNASDMTIESYSRDYKVLVEFLESNKIDLSIDNLTTQVLRRYINFMKKDKNYSSTTLNRKINSLRSFAKFLVINEYMDINFMDRITAPKKEKKLPKVMTEQELEKFLGVILKHSKDNGLRDRIIFSLYAASGMRRQELLNLNIEDIDLGINVIKVLKGKGGKDRVIPLFEPTTSYLWEYLMTRLPVKDNKEPLFLSGYGNRMSVTAVQQLFRRYMKIAHLDDRGYTIHTLRHTYATLILKNGGNLMEIKDLLGHADLNSTSIYLHTTVEHLRKTSKLHPLAKKSDGD
jgi:site-specific recombinase XerD